MLIFALLTSQHNSGFFWPPPLYTVQKCKIKDYALLRFFREQTQILKINCIHKGFIIFLLENSITFDFYFARIDFQSNV
jgi:hypothetical protein